jgi:hypothetical protein
MAEPSLDQAVADYKSAAEKLSESSRKIGYGLAAVFFTVAFADAGSLKALMDNCPKLMLSVGVGGVLTVLADYLHNFFAYKSAIEAGAADGVFNVRGFQYRAHSVFFWLKQLIGVIGIVALFWVLLSALMQRLGWC